MKRILLLAVVALAHPSFASVSPVSYDMLNGDGQASGGSFNYWDLFYTGSGLTSVDSSPLTGGLGDLTDGVIATDNWFNVENAGGTGPYVGWRDKDPEVTFHFAGTTAINDITVYADDSKGTGGVSLPKGVVINGTLFSVDPGMGGSEPKTLVFDNLGLNTDTVTVQFLRSDTWVFVSEVQFNAVPEPVTLAAFGLGVASLVRKRFRKS